MPKSMIAKILGSHHWKFSQYDFFELREMSQKAIGGKSMSSQVDLETVLKSMIVIICSGLASQFHLVS